MKIEKIVLCIFIICIAINLIDYVINLGLPTTLTYIGATIYLLVISMGLPKGEE